MRSGRNSNSLKLVCMSLLPTKMKKVKSKMKSKEWSQHYSCCKYIGVFQILKGSSIIWKNGSLRNRENLQYMKTANSVLLSQFMRTNGNCNSPHAPSTSLNGVLLSISTVCGWIWSKFKFVRAFRIVIVSFRNEEYPFESKR